MPQFEMEYLLDNMKVSTSLFSMAFLAHFTMHIVVSKHQLVELFQPSCLHMLLCLHSMSREAKELCWPH